MGIRAWVLIAALLAVLPMLAFSVWSVVELDREHRLRDLADLIERSRAAAQALRRRLDRAEAALQAQAVSPAALTRDYAALYLQAERVMASHADALGISLINRDGEQRFITVRPFGAALPISRAVDDEQAVFERGTTVHSRLFQGGVTGRWVMTVAVPVRHGAEVEYALRMSLPGDALRQPLGEIPMRPRWVAAVIDPHGLVAARAPAGDEGVGEPIAPALRDAIAEGRACPVRVPGSESGESVTCVSDVPGSGWRVAVTAPVDAFEGDLSTSLARLLWGGLASMVIGTLGALLAANLIHRQIRALAVRADETVSPTPLPGAPASSPSRITEVAVAADGLEQARRQHDELEARLERARHDGLTGLPRRDLFRERVRRDLAHPASPAERIALLFVDLDGFKAVNDRLGHEAGDAILRRVGDVIAQVVRGGDLSSRLGGDEFVVYLRASADGIAAVSEAVAQRLMAGVEALGDGLSCSIGIARGPAHDAAVDELMQAADQLMLAAKRAGKARVVARDWDV